ncbi:signal peptidase I [Delftia acidovorans]|jgi:conjugal transfer pilin signal peptidase TrbI|nr:signal peptidase I [Delftia acidovorans]
MKAWVRKLFRVWLVTNAVSIALITLGLWLSGLRIGIDVQRLIGEPACMPSLVYIWNPGLSEPAKVGHYVLARMPATGLGVGARPGDRIVKRVRAVAGDTVKVEGTELYINGKHQDNDRLWLAKSIPGKEPGDFDREVTLGDGELFLMGTTRESFDSRYWGPVKREAILGSAIPLF